MITKNDFVDVTEKMSSIATLFSGGEGVGVGAKLAGLQHLWGIEIDDVVAQVARNNGFSVQTADILTADPSKYQVPTVLHASPPCISYSLANKNRQETANDITLAKAVAKFIKKLHPQFFILENVWGYRLSESWRIISDCLTRTGYWFDLSHVNAADFGVPQTRRRMIVRASAGYKIPALPQAEPWISWYSAIEDLISSLPETQLASWQKAGLNLTDTILIDSAGYSRRADDVRIPVTRCSSSPANTIIASHGKRGGTRAFLVGGQRGNSSNPRRTQTREIVEPAFTITAGNKGDWSICVGKVMRLTPRALARLQTFPDSYILPKSKTLAHKIIGMAVPPLFYQKIVSQLVSSRGRNLTLLPTIGGQQ